VYSYYPLNDQTIDHIQKEYSRSDLPWYLGFSGGKDSSALLKLVFIALLNLDNKPKPVTVIFCDTGVEIPVVRNLALRSLHGLRAEAKGCNVPIKVKIVHPRLNDRYFVKVIGRGYPPPSNKFRWCTDRLRIAPVKQALSTLPTEHNVVLLGIRRGESLERDKTITRHSTEAEHYFRHSDSKSLIYGPLVDYTVEDVWNTLTFNPVPESLEVEPLLTLYQETSGECPIIRDPKGAPCGKGRFGCWTCTVVRKDRAMANLVKKGHPRLTPLLNFRNWLMLIRDNPAYRCKRRRNGVAGLGPFNLDARREILAHLLEAQAASGLPLIRAEELELIEQLWTLDENSPAYRRIEG
jgi:DNA sulfur modification protein DndC